MIVTGRAAARVACGVGLVCVRGALGEEAYAKAGLLLIPWSTTPDGART